MVTGREMEGRTESEKEKQKGNENENRKEKRRIVWHKELCVGCQACVAACMDQNDIRPEAGERAFCNVAEEETEGRLLWKFTSCRHCQEPVCGAACPNGCIRKDPETGMVLLDEEHCSGCGRCIQACPFHVISFRAGNLQAGNLQAGNLRTGNQTAAKCDGCVERIKNNMIPACVRACPMKALRFHIGGSEQTQ